MGQLRLGEKPDTLTYARPRHLAGSHAIAHAQGLALTATEPIARRNGLKSLPAEKSGSIVALTLLSWIAVSFLSWIAFRGSLPGTISVTEEIIVRALYLPLILFWLWGIHNFWHQVLTLFYSGNGVKLAPVLDGPPVAILYLTCDDFDPIACRSCLDQTYPNTRLVICDDSKRPESKRSVDEWAKRYGSRVAVLRRDNRSGFKAGNLNHAISASVSEEYIVICDADEIIPPGFVAGLLPYAFLKDVAFVQACHTARTRGQTHFAEMMSPSIEIYYRHNLPLRNAYGFVSCFGHGIMINRSAWESVGGFPEIVSEDLGFAGRALAKGLRGIYTRNVVAQESFPPTYTAFMKRERKIIGGTIEFFQKELPGLLRSKKATLTEKLDVLLTFSFCFIGLVTMINVLGGIWLAHTYATHGHEIQGRWFLLFYLVGPLTPVAPLARYLFFKPMRYGHYFFTSAIAFVSLVPTFATKAIEQIFHIRRQDFDVTGQIARQRQTLINHLFPVACGFIVLATALLLPSRVLAPAVGVSAMFIIGPALCFTELKGLFGFLARNSGIFPYAAISAILFLWK